jgi:hypothetical protein
MILIVLLIVLLILVLVLLLLLLLLLLYYYYYTTPSPPPQVKARGARVIVITDRAALADGIDPAPIVIPSNGPLTAMIGVRTRRRSSWSRSRIV